MRVLFLLLLLANLLFLAWTRWVVAPGPAARVVAGQPSTPLRPIRLQQEAPGASTNGAGAPQTTAGDELTAASCVSVGPFLEPTQAEASASALRRLGFTSRLRSSTDEVRVGYWVRVPDFATVADANNALATLQAAGLADAYVIGDEGPASVVSIGVYADARRAADVAAAVSRAGFTPQTSDRVRTLDVFWLDVDRQANGGIPELEDAGPPPEAGLPLELRVCPSAPVETPVPAAG